MIGRRERRQAGRRESIVDVGGAGTASSDGSPESERTEGDRKAGIRGRDHQDVEGATLKCPHCGKETDAELDFCHWCTEPLPGPDEE
ncbi:hypothetical protein ACFQAS_09995 [Halopenitus salinus]|uniref:DUF7575 domain-containing protein n=1 Tax=Halopenitus salinus TaxID=1198295 RepID=A0ABD5UWW4_9EURY